MAMATPDRSAAAQRIGNNGKAAAVAPASVAMITLAITGLRRPVRSAGFPAGSSKGAVTGAGRGPVSGGLPPPQRLRPFCFLLSDVMVLYDQAEKCAIDGGGSQQQFPVNVGFGVSTLYLG